MISAFIYVHRELGANDLAINVAHIIGVERHASSGRAVLTLTGPLFETVRESYEDVLFLISETAPKPLEAVLDSKG